ncbi:glycine betaine ABC transporter substrate-binding protein [Glycocaulis alkaliphilus]|uniref:Glycine betaine ABC transporter substrate-binding protein n=1 Tax=Glycocaulis alkaliphilus TaxID=1434191 RepID=A0A3T0E8B2_9PROT|nr:ABC transporter permease/substrate-binding protein [Glycocaulis alkaliphilus]AZU03572.1 glycine betaine ABC transporter substrate-binding protein [Glycocaulis alkaliphilus]GGB74567.1 ABC transporter permease [Glycocaulis alkaliphilus]
MMEALAQPLALLPDYLGGHLRLSLGAMACGLLIALPLGVAAARNRTIAGPALAIAGIFQTIPALALLALMVPLLGGRIGFMPAFAALTLYAILPVLRNTIVGLRGVDPVVREAARGVGMTRAQSLFRVELPLALPSIMAGIRTASVWVIGAATLATPVGAASLGNYIFSGLQTRNWTLVIFGCVAAALSALIIDGLLKLMESAAARRRAGRALVSGAALAVIAAMALMPAGLFASGGDARSARSALHAQADGFGGQPVTIGAKAFTEQYILAGLMESVLRDAGAAVRRRDNLGSTVAFDALISGEVDVYVDYSGTLWATLMQREDMPGRHVMLAEITSWMWTQHGVLVLGALGFENAYGIAVSRELAARRALSSITDLSAIDGVSIGADSEFFARAEWSGLRDTYGLARARTRAMDSTFMYTAVRDGEVDAITAYTTDGRITAFDLVILDDPAGILPPYDALVLISPAAARRPAIAQALAPLLNAIDAEAMREANGVVDLERRAVGEAVERLRARLDPRFP